MTPSLTDDEDPRDPPSNFVGDATRRGVLSAAFMRRRAPRTQAVDDQGGPGGIKPAAPPGAHRRRTTLDRIMTVFKWAGLALICTAVAVRLAYDLWLLRAHTAAAAAQHETIFEEPTRGSLVFATAREVMFGRGCSYDPPLNISAIDVANLAALTSPGVPCVCSPMVVHIGGGSGLHREGGPCLIAVRGIGVLAHPVVKDLHPSMQVVTLGGSPACPEKYAEFTTPSVLMLRGIDAEVSGSARQVRIEDGEDGVAHCVWRCVTAMHTGDKDSLLRPCHARQGGSPQSGSSQ